ncbi:MAG: hypothetical protein M1304_00475 [Candidatus Thermoplasmatota archaeon]|jgi:hypothetical protein|nr:hypothetical protein [Candidatus Thermoplasmatota archaeon]MCL5732571.1 hypothetical protein [Candidatus Thermoplasmatota archaeon]
MTSVDKGQVIQWLAGGDETSTNLVDIPWKVRDLDKFLVLESDKVPFSLFLSFEEKTVKIFFRTGIETAVLENQPRLAIYRTLLLLNRQIDLVKFMLDGMNEEVVSRVDLELEGLTKAELNEGLNTLLSSIYLMIRALKLEEQFQAEVTQRMVMMVQDMINQGKSRDDIENYLVAKVGLSKEDAEILLNRLIGQSASKDHSGMYA